jgi:hypothetical protein
MEIKLIIMKNTFFKILILSLVIIHISCKTTELSSNNKYRKEQEHYLKDYLLCNCIRQTYSNTEVYNDVSITSLYSNLIDDFDPIVLDSLNKEIIPVIKEIKPIQASDMYPKKPYLSFCIDYYNSKKMDSIIKILSDRYLNNKILSQKSK